MDRLNFRCDAEKRDEQTTAQTGTGRTRMATKALPPISNTGAKKRILFLVLVPRHERVFGHNSRRASSATLLQTYERAYEHRIHTDG